MDANALLDDGYQIKSVLYSMCPELESIFEDVDRGIQMGCEFLICQMN